MTNKSFSLCLDRLAKMTNMLATGLRMAVETIDHDLYETHCADIDDLCYTLTRVKLDCECLIADMKMLGDID